MPRVRTHADSLASYLATLAVPALAEILSRHPAAFAAPRPLDLRQVAVRILTSRRGHDFITGRDLGQLQILEVACACAGDPAAGVADFVDAGAMRLLLGVDQDDAVDSEARRALAVLTGDLLIWPFRDGFVLHPAIPEWLSAPLGLGAPARAAFADAPAEEIRAMIRALAGPDDARPATADGLATALGEEAVVHAALATIPEGHRKTLTALVRHGSLYDPAATVATGWLAERGLVCQKRWSVSAVMPREVGLLLRGPAFRAPLTLAPTLVGKPVPDSDLAGAAEAAATLALAGLDRFLTTVADGGFSVLKNGGVGAAELRRLGRMLGRPIPEARWLLYLAREMDLIGTVRDALVVTRARVWRETDPARRLADVLTAWTQMEAWPLVDTPTARPGQAAAPLSPEDSQPDAPAVRRTVLQILATLGAGRGLQDEELTELVHYAAPAVFKNPDPSGRDFEAARWERSAPHYPDLAVRVLAEAELLGVVAFGALTELGAALASGDKHRLDTAAAATLPITQACTVLADHTVLATGIPTAELEQFLQSFAEPTRRDSHTSSWRITPTSVRAVFDADPHADPQRLVDRLAAVSATPVPQTVDYLIRDVARRHGTVTVTAVQTLIRVSAPGAADELLATRELADLGLTRVGDTALVSTKSEQRVLTALRSVGLAPAGSALDGTLQAASTSRTGTSADPTPAKPGKPRPPRRGVDLTAWLTGLPAAEEPALDSAAEQIAAATPMLGRADCVRLAQAVDTGQSVHVEYDDRSYGRRKLVVSAVRIVEKPYYGLMLEGTSTSKQLPLAVKDLLLVLPMA